MSDLTPVASICLKGNIKESTPINIIPCQLDYTGHANVSSFFQQKLELDGWKSFRGHALQPFNVQVPSEFQINTIKREEDNYVVESVNNQLTSWERDLTTKYTADLQKSLNFLPVAKAFAIDDEDSE